jgi:Peptidase family M1 domain
MGRRSFLLVSAFLIVSSSVSGQSSSLFDRLHDAILERNEQAFLSLVEQDPERQENQKEFIRSIFAFRYEKGIIHLAEEDDHKMILHLFFQGREEARFESWIVRIQTDKNNEKRIQACDTINSISGLYRLKLSDRPFLVHNLKYKHFDSMINFQDGYIFPIMAGNQYAGIIFQGTGTFEFEPKDPTEKQQITLFAKTPRLQAKITSLFLRASIEGLSQILEPLEQQKREPNAALYSKAQMEAKDFDRNVYSVRIPFSDESWFAQLEEAELYCEMKTSVGTLVYQHSPGEQDDILLAHKDKDQILSLYKSNEDRQPEEEARDFTILSYKMNLRFQPLPTYLTAATEVRLKSEKETSTIIFRLNPELQVSQIRSSQGYLIYFQERQTNNLHLVLNNPLQKGDEIKLEFFYQGKIAPEKRTSETMQLQREQEREFYVPPTYLYSNQSLWYPQLASKPYAAVQATVTVPENYAAIMNGQQTGTEKGKGTRTFSFQCKLPAKYFSLFVGRLDQRLTFQSVVPIDVYFLSLDKKAAEEYAKAADRILRFYSKYFGDYPYQNLAIVLRPIQQPGGHAPATVAIVNRVFKFFQKKFARDPLYLPDYPHFVLAHEIAHQWWGQTVGWRTYHDQWLSEGFAQFAAWEYMRQQYGEATWKKLGKIFQEWVEEKSYAGPLILGARLGHITDDPQAYSALLYNKGAYTLNMLKEWMGEENFKKLLREFFEAYQFRRVGIDEFISLAQQHTEEDLKPFFRQWLYWWDVPDVRWTTQVEGADLKINFKQLQQNSYFLKIPVQARSTSGQAFRFIASVEKPEQLVTVKLPFAPAAVEVDPLRETLMKTETR